MRGKYHDGQNAIRRRRALRDTLRSSIFSVLHVRDTADLGTVITTGHWSAMVDLGSEDYVWLAVNDVMVYGPETKYPSVDEVMALMDPSGLSSAEPEFGKDSWFVFIGSTAVSLTYFAAITDQFVARASMGASIRWLAKPGDPRYPVLLEVDGEVVANIAALAPESIPQAKRGEP